MNLAIEALDVKPAEAGRVELEVRLSNGKAYTLYAATPEAAPGWVGKGGAAWGLPTLYVKSLDPESLRGAVEAMAADLSGYWLRYYGSAARERTEGSK